MFDNFIEEYSDEYDELEYKRRSKLHLMFLRRGFQHQIKPIDVDCQTDRIVYEHATQ